MSLNETVIGGLIGVGGTVIGTIIGYLLPTIGKNFGRKVLTLSDTDIILGTGKSDSEGSRSWTKISFTLTVLNKKGKNLFLEKPECVFYCGSEKLAKYKCDDDETKQLVASRLIYDPILYIDIPPKSSTQRKLHVSSGKDLSSCDKVVFVYSWGSKTHERIVWTKENKHANT